MAAEWPDNDERAILTVACCGTQLTARVDSSEANECVVYVEDHHCSESFTNVEGDILSWFSTAACWTREVEIRGAGGYPRSSRWALEAMGPPVRWQRREFVRAPATLSVEAVADETTSAELNAVDIGEGGLRCELNKEMIDVLPQSFQVTFRLDDCEITEQCRIAWTAQEGEEADDLYLAGLTFEDTDERTADIIRNYVFRIQLETRRRNAA